jgi:hypothetical protein
VDWWFLPENPTPKWEFYAIKVKKVSAASTVPVYIRSTMSKKMNLAEEQRIRSAWFIFPRWERRGHLFLYVPERIDDGRFLG